MKTSYLAIVMLLMCSCTVTEMVTQTKTLKPSGQKYVGNDYEDMVGLTENQIMQKMSVPTRRESDGNGGKILVYEEIKYVTSSSESYSARSNSYGTTDTYAEAGTVGRSAGYGDAVGYNDGTVAASAAGYIGASSSYSAGAASSVSQNTSSTDTHRQAQSVSKQEKKYVNFFIDAEGKCYHVKANIGNRYERTPGTYQKCKYEVKKYKPAGFALYLCGFIPGFIYTMVYLHNKFHPQMKEIECGSPYQK